MKNAGLFSISALFTYSAYAANAGDIAGDVYSTDIVAYVDDMPIRSF